MRKARQRPWERVKRNKRVKRVKRAKGHAKTRHRWSTMKNNDAPSLAK